MSVDRCQFELSLSLNTYLTTELAYIFACVTDNKTALKLVRNCSQQLVKIH
jgi:hypothetical protein